MKLQQLGRSCHDLLAPQAAVFSLALTRALALALCLGLMSGTAEASTYRLLLGVSATQDSVTTATDSTFSVLDNSAFELDIGLQHVSTDAGDFALGASDENLVTTWGMALSWYSVPGTGGHGVAAGFVVEGAGGAIIAGTVFLTSTTARSFSTDASVSLSGGGSIEDIFPFVLYSTTLVTITPSGETDMVSLWQHTLVLAAQNATSMLQCKFCRHPDLLTLRLRAVNLESAPSYARKLYHAVRVPDGDGSDLLVASVDSYTNNVSAATLTRLSSTLTAAVATINDAATISDITSEIYGPSIEFDTASSSATPIWALAIADGGGDGIDTHISSMTLRVGVGSAVVTPLYSALALPENSQHAVPSLDFNLHRIDAGGTAVGAALATLTADSLSVRRPTQSLVVTLVSPLVIADGGSERLGLFAFPDSLDGLQSRADIVDGSQLMLELRPSEIVQPAGVISSRFSTATNTVGSVTMAVVGTVLRLNSMPTVPSSATIDVTGDGIGTPYAATYRYRDGGVTVAQNILRLTVVSRDSKGQLDLDSDLSSSALNAGFNTGFSGCSGGGGQTRCAVSLQAGTFGYVREISYYSLQDHGTVVASIPSPHVVFENTVNLTLSMDVTGGRLETHDAVSASFGGGAVEPAMLLHDRSYMFEGSYLSFAELQTGPATILPVYDLDDVSATIELAVSGVLGCELDSSCSAPVAGAVTLTAPANTVQIDGIDVPLIEFSLAITLPTLPMGLLDTPLTLAIMSTATGGIALTVPTPTSFTVLGVVPTTVSLIDIGQATLSNVLGSTEQRVMALSFAEGAGDSMGVAISSVLLSLLAEDSGIAPIVAGIDSALTRGVVPALTLNLYAADAAGNATGAVLAATVTALARVSSGEQMIRLTLGTPLSIAEGGTAQLLLTAAVANHSALLSSDAVDAGQLRLRVSPATAGVFGSGAFSGGTLENRLSMEVIGTTVAIDSVSVGSAPSVTGSTAAGFAVQTDFRAGSGAASTANVVVLNLRSRDASGQLDLNADLSAQALVVSGDTDVEHQEEILSSGHVRNLYFSPIDGRQRVFTTAENQVTVTMNVSADSLETLAAVTARNSSTGIAVAGSSLIHDASYSFSGTYHAFLNVDLSGTSPAFNDSTAKVYDRDPSGLSLTVTPQLSCTSDGGGCTPLSPLSATTTAMVTVAAAAERGVISFTAPSSGGFAFAQLPSGLLSSTLSLTIALQSGSAYSSIPAPSEFTLSADLVPPTICDGDLDSVANACLSVDSAELRAYSATLLFSELASDRAQLSEAATPINTAASYWLAFHTGTTCAIASITAMSSQLSLSATGGSGQLNALSQGTAYCVFLAVRDAGGSTVYSAPVMLNTAAFSLTDADNDGLSDDLEYDFMPVGGLTVCPDAACDTDGDGLSDSLEAYLNSDLSNTTGASAATDADSDGLPDVVELYYGRRDELSSAATVLPRQNARGVLTDFASFTNSSGTASLSLPLDSVVHISAGVYQGGVLPAADSHNYVSGTHWLSSGSAASDAVIRRLELRPVLSVGGDLSVIAGGSGSMRLQLLGAQPDGDGAVALSLSSSGLALMASSLSLSGAVEQAVGYTVSTSTLTVMATVQLDNASLDLVSLCSFSASCSSSTTYSIVYQPALRAVAAYAPVIQLRQSGSSALLQSIADPAAGVEFSVSGSVVNSTRTWTLSVLGSSTPATPSVALAGTYSVAGSVFGSNAAVYRIGAESTGESLQRVFSVGQLDSDGDLIPDTLEVPGLVLVNSALPYGDSAGTANAHFMLVAPGIILRLGDIAAQRPVANSPRVPLSEFAALGIAPLPVSVVDNLVLDVSFSCGDSAACFSAGDLLDFVFSVDGAISTDKLYHYSSTCPSAATASWCEVDTSQRTITIDSGPGMSSATVIVANTVTFSPYLSVAGTSGRACPAPGDAAYLPLLSLVAGALSNGGCVHVSATSDSLSPLALQATSGSEVVVFHGGGGTVGLPWLALLALMMLLSLGRSGQWHRRGVAMAGAALLSLCLSLPATAAALDFGISGAVGQSFLKPSLQSSTFRLDDQEDFAYRVGVDYALPFKLPLFVITLEDLWLEGFWADLGESRVCNATACGGVEQTAAGAGVNWFPYGRDRRWSPYASLGWRSGDAKSRQWRVAVKNDDGLYWGLGMELDLAGNPARGLALKIFYEDYDLGTAFAGAGLSYRFNGAAEDAAPSRRPQASARRREELPRRPERTRPEPTSQRPSYISALSSPCTRPGASVCACLDTVRGHQGWYVQVAAYANVLAAERTAQKLLAQGFGAVRVGIGAVDRDNGSVLYAVRLALDSPAACGRAAVIKRDVDELLNVESVVRAWFDYPW